MKKLIFLLLLIPSLLKAQSNDTSSFMPLRSCGFMSLPSCNYCDNALARYIIYSDCEDYKVGDITIKGDTFLVVKQLFEQLISYRERFYNAYNVIGWINLDLFLELSETTKSKNTKYIRKDIKTYKERESLEENKRKEYFKKYQQ